MQRRRIRRQPRDQFDPFNCVHIVTDERVEAVDYSRENFYYLSPNNDSIQTGMEALESIIRRYALSIETTKYNFRNRLFSILLNFALTDVFSCRSLEINPFVLDNSIANQHEYLYEELHEVIVERMEEIYGELSADDKVETLNGDILDLIYEDWLLNIADELTRQPDFSFGLWHPQEEQFYFNEAFICYANPYEMMVSVVIMESQ